MTCELRTSTALLLRAVWPWGGLGVWAHVMVPDEMKERVFEPNFTTKSSGMGLGLAMVRNLIQNFGGTIDFENKGQGAAFTITIPIQQNNRS